MSYFSEQYWTVGALKVLLVLRRQPEWLASLYAERSKLNFGASQAHFEKEVDKLIERQDDFIDWSKWVNDLYHYIGKEHVCVLFMEDMNKQEFWEKLNKFVMLEEFNFQEVVNEKGKKFNKRSSELQSWNISTLYPVQSIKQNYDKNKYMTRILCELARFVSLFVDPTCFDYKRDKKIFINKSLEKRIMNYCRPFNERLAEQLGLDLRERGYLL